MKVIVKARHMALTEPLKAYAEEKLGKSIMRILDRPAARLDIELSDLGNIKNGANMECKVILHVPKGKAITIGEIDDNMYKAIDLAHDRLLYQVKREHDRQVDTTRMRKNAVRERERTAKESLTSTPEVWEQEVREYENSTVV